MIKELIISTMRHSKPTAQLVEDLIDYAQGQRRLLCAYNDDQLLKMSQRGLIYMHISPYKLKVYIKSTLLIFERLGSTCTYQFHYINTIDPDTTQRTCLKNAKDKNSYTVHMDISDKLKGIFECLIMDTKREEVLAGMTNTPIPTCYEVLERKLNSTLYK